MDVEFRAVRDVEGVVPYRQSLSRYATAPFTQGSLILHFAPCILHLYLWHMERRYSLFSFAKTPDLFSDGGTIMNKL